MKIRTVVLRQGFPREEEFEIPSGGKYCGLVYRPCVFLNLWTSFCSIFEKKLPGRRPTAFDCWSTVERCQECIDAEVT